ncbi:alternative ribosome rescue aminoacyl-tRNA hydrolase ArfB [Solidesulfovibrio sp.]
MDSLPITSRVAIPLAEISFIAARSGGPGGQHVNTTSTKVTLLFDLGASPSLTEYDKARIREALEGRIGKDGVLRVVSQSTRSQFANREIALERFAVLLRAALTPVAPRKKTRVSLAAKRRRVDDKKRQGARKQERRVRDDH